MPCGQEAAGRAQPKDAAPSWAELEGPQAVNPPRFMLVHDVDLGCGHAGHQDLGTQPQTGVQVWKMPGALQAVLWAGDVGVPSRRGPMCYLSYMQRAPWVKAEGRCPSKRSFSCSVWSDGAGTSLHPPTKAEAASGAQSWMCCKNKKTASHACFPALSPGFFAPNRGLQDGQ